MDGARGNETPAEWPISVFLPEDHEVFRRGLRQLLADAFAGGWGWTAARRHAKTSEAQPATGWLGLPLTSGPG